VNYLLPQLTATQGYAVFLYAPLFRANSPARTSGFQWYMGFNGSGTLNYLSVDGQTMANVYGGDFSAYSISGFVWSAEARITITAPQANIAGQAYVGRIAYNQF